MMLSVAAEASSTRMPFWRTSTGRRASTRFSRFCTSTEASDGSVPGRKVAVMFTEPNESVVDSKLMMLAAPFSSSSMSRVVPV